MTVPIVFCSHLRYRDVQQRPQRIAQLLAKEQLVVYVEEPWWPRGDERRFEKPPHLAVSFAGDLGGGEGEVGENLTVVTPVVPHQEVELPYVTPENEALARRLVAGYLSRAGVDRAIMWIYSPMMDGYYGGVVEELAVVHDKMDELAGFKGTPPVVVERERTLIERADVLFAGGRTMFESARARHSNCHRFDSGVDFEHFRAAALPETRAADDVRDLPHPVFGYIGVIDERVDFEALVGLAEAYPRGSVFMGGPVRKILPSELPRRPNLIFAHDLDVARGRDPLEAGSIPYAQLPRFIKGFDVCLIPFSGKTEATKNLSPTKTPEYAAGLKPIISGAVPDVVATWGDVVWVADSPAEYVGAAGAILERDHADRLARAQARAAEQTWDSIVAAMRKEIELVLREG